MKKLNNDKAKDSPEPCFASLSMDYINYLNLCVPEDADPLSLSIQDCHFKGREDQRFEIIQIGDGTSHKDAYVRLPEGDEVWIKLSSLQVVSGSLRNVKKRGLIRMGKTSLMGSVCNGIKSGKAFRGR